jgi:pathogenesis-related protein 1
VASAFVEAHDHHRAQVSPPASPTLPPVRWSEELAARAQAWADRCEFEHSQTDAGENLAARTQMITPEEIVAGWAAEGEHYDYARNRCAKGEVCGHYTQVVWRDSTQIGCGVAQCPSGGPFGEHEWVFWVCNYSPAGNWQGQKPY